jgi:proprotein convertase subtilisin/kexin type 5
MYPTSTQCLNCVSPCVICTSLSACKSCVPSFYLTGTSCVVASSCPAGTYAESLNNTCNACTSPCQNCSNIGTNCTSCISPNLYYSNTCVVTCPTLMYPTSTQCLNCVSPCANCTTLSACKSCVAGFYLTGTSCVVASSCPAGTYAESLNNTCNTCTSPCQTCDTFGTNCTSCISPNLYYSNTCVVTCPASTYPTSTQCLNCVSPCVTCTSASACKSCVPSFYLTGTSCVTASSCPAGTYAESLNNTCNVCTSPCQNCSNIGTNCTSCISPNLYYSNTCVVTCPALMYPTLTQCLNCLSPCVTCTSASACKSCVAGFYLTGTSCVVASSCPAGTYAESLNNTCNTCTSPCQTCDTFGTNCTSCINGYLYYSNLCVSTCPSTMYPTSTLCVNCVSPCITCTSASACKSCISGTYLTSTSCVVASSCPAGTYP